MRALRSHCRPTAHGCNGRRRARRWARKRGRGRPQRLLRRARRRRGDGGGGAAAAAGSVAAAREAVTQAEGTKRGTATARSAAVQPGPTHNSTGTTTSHANTINIKAPPHLPHAPALANFGPRGRQGRQGRQGRLGWRRLRRAPPRCCRVHAHVAEMGVGRSAAVRARFHRVRARHPGMRACVLSRWCDGLSVSVIISARWLFLYPTESVS